MLFSKTHLFFSKTDIEHACRGQESQDIGSSKFLILEVITAGLLINDHHFVCVDLLQNIISPTIKIYVYMYMYILYPVSANDQPTGPHI